MNETEARILHATLVEKRKHAQARVDKSYMEASSEKLIALKQLNEITSMIGHLAVAWNPKASAKALAWLEGQS